MEIAGSYPIILDGEAVGEVTVSREGLFWSFEAKCEMREEIVRLSVYGSGKEGYLGIMEPFGDMLRLTKKFSRSALKEFPESISHAGQKGEPEGMAPPTFEEQQTYSELKPAETAQYGGEFPLSCYNGEDGVPIAPPKDDKPPPFKSEDPLRSISELDWYPCTLPCSLFSGLNEKKYCSYITGSYIAHGDDFQLLAIPEDVAALLPEESLIRFIDKIIFFNSTYLVCKIKQGKSVSEQ